MVENDDRRIKRLIGFLKGSTHHMLKGCVDDPPGDLELWLYVDANFCGDSDNTRSTSGGWLILAGPNTRFPIAWVSKRQTATSRSTTEAETVSLGKTLFDEALPTLDLWELILGSKGEACH